MAQRNSPFLRGFPQLHTDNDVPQRSVRRKKQRISADTSTNTTEAVVGTLFPSLSDDVATYLLSQACASSPVLALILRHVSRGFRSVCDPMLPKKQHETFTDLCALEGNLAAIRWARKKGASLSNDVLTYAAKGGHLDVIAWLEAHRTKFFSPYSIARELSRYLSWI